jgi:hypothetical protein
MIPTAISLVLAACASFQEPRFAPDAAEWEARDLEGRWVLIERETLEHGWANAEPLVAFLEERREAELLEWMCLYPRTEGHAQTFLAALARLEAPQWARAVLWVARDQDSHTYQSAYKAFSARPGLAVDWLRRHEARLQEPLARMLERLGEDALAAPVDSSSLLPPWSDEEALAHLLAPGLVADFGDRPRAQVEVTYLHQVERELRAVAHAQIYSAPWLERLRDLTRHERPEVRSFAWIALGEARRGTIEPGSLPLAPFETAVSDPLEDGRVRNSALLSLSQRAPWTPAAWFLLHEVALDPVHPAWTAAILRLRELGDEFTIAQLAALERRLAPDDQVRRSVVGDTLAALRAAATEASLAARDVTQALERTAWMDLTCGRFEGERKDWTVACFAPPRLSTEARQALARIRDAYEPAPDLSAELPAPIASLWAERVRAWARRLATP